MGSSRISADPIHHRNSWPRGALPPFNSIGRHKEREYDWEKKKGRGKFEIQERAHENARKRKNRRLISTGLGKRKGDRRLRMAGKKRLFLNRFQLIESFDGGTEKERRGKKENRLQGGRECEGPSWNGCFREIAMTLRSEESPVKFGRRGRGGNSRGGGGTYGAVQMVEKNRGMISIYYRILIGVEGGERC